MRPAWLSRRVSGEPRRYHRTRLCATRRYEPELVTERAARKIARLCATCARAGT